MDSIHASVLRKKRQKGRIVWVADPEEMDEILSLQLVIASVVEVAELLRVPIDRIDDNGALGVLPPIVRSRGIRHPEGIRFSEDQFALADVMFGVRQDVSTPDVEFEDVDAVQTRKIAMGRLKKSPLVALEVEPDRKAQHRRRIEPQRMQGFDPDVDVAVFFHPSTIIPVQVMH